MKKAIATLLILTTLICSLAGCTNIKNVNPDGSISVDKYKIEAIQDPYSQITMFKDSQNYYYMIPLGTIRNVPLDTPNSHFYSGDETSLSITISEVSSDTITNMLTKAEEKCTSQSFSSAVTGSIGKNEATYASLELGYSNSKTSSVTRTEGIEKCRSYSSQHSETITVPMSGKKPGYYRYVLMGDIESYVAVIYNLENKTYTHTTYSVIISQGFVLDYSETLEFDDSNQQKIQFTFDENKIKNMIPTLEIGTKVDVSGLPAPLTYDSGYKEKKVDASHSYYYDTLDLYSLKSYFHPSYIFTFNIRVLMKEENAGFQEIYLTNGKDGKDSRVGGNGSIEYGGSGSAYETKGWTEISVTVRGDQCAETMYLEYGAHGDSSDDWYRYQAQVTITVTASEN